MPDIMQFRAPVPPIPLQRGIADFLDRKTAAIDVLIEKKERLIALLAEKRAALIHQAVTKGLDPNVPMKDSGVPWIGQIPAHWGVAQLKRMFVLQRGVDITKEAQVDGDVPVISSGGPSSFHNKAYAKGPGVLVGRKGSAGKMHYSHGDYWPHDTTLWVQDFKSNHPRYVYYKLVDMHLEAFDTGATNPTVNRNLVHPMLIAWPPVAEQASIANHLDSVDAQQSSQTALLQESIDRLKEYRQSLITAAVTGQLPIPEKEPPS
jgi:type I restriction enzyme S subunit